MNYESRATSVTPASIIYLLDISQSMSSVLSQGKTRISVVEESLDAIINMMARRSVLGGSGEIRPRYRIAIFAYSRDVYPILDKFTPINEVAELGIPELEPKDLTHSAKAFEAAEQLLIKAIPDLDSRCPAPLVCHITDGKYNGNDPEPIVNRIKNLTTPDGNVLVENIFIAPEVLSRPIKDPYQWPGIHDPTVLKTAYAKKLYDLSSVIPESYVDMMNEYGGGNIQYDAKMMLPGTASELVELGFVMSMSTKTLLQGSNR